MNIDLNNLLRERILIKEKYNNFNKIFLIIALILFNIGFIGFLYNNFKILYISEFILLLELILFSILCLFFRKKDNIIIKNLEKNELRINIDNLNDLLLECSRKRKFLDLLSNVIIIFAVVIFLVSLLLKVKTNTNIFYEVKNSVLVLFVATSFMEWKYTKLIDKTIAVAENKLL